MIYCCLSLLPFIWLFSNSRVFISYGWLVVSHSIAHHVPVSMNHDVDGVGAVSYTHLTLPTKA